MTLRSGQSSSDDLMSLAAMFGNAELQLKEDYAIDMTTICCFFQPCSYVQRTLRTSLIVLSFVRSFVCLLEFAGGGWKHGFGSLGGRWRQGSLRAELVEPSPDALC